MRTSFGSSVVAITTTSIAAASACASSTTPRVAGTVVVTPLAASTAPSTGGDTPSPPPKQREDETPSSDEPLPWLVGRWQAPRKTCWPISWSEPNELQASRRDRCDTADVRFALELVFTASPGKLEGVLTAVAEDGHPHEVVELVIEGDNGGYSLVWHEGGVRYVFSGQPQASASLDSQLARFYLERNPSSRSPYPIVIDLRLTGGELSLRRAHGPQHGAAVERTYTFERPRLPPRGQ